MRRTIGDTLAPMDDLCCSPLLSADLDETEAEELASVLKALADPVRLRLVNVIAASGEGCACDFPAAVGKSPLVIRKAPSPASATTSRSGISMPATSAVGRAKLIAFQTPDCMKDQGVAIRR